MLQFVFLFSSFSNVGYFLLSEMINNLSKFIFRCALFHQFFFICLQRSVVYHSVKFCLKCNPPPTFYFHLTVDTTKTLCPADLCYVISKYVLYLFVLLLFSSGPCKMFYRAFHNWDMFTNPFAKVKLEYWQHLKKEIGK